MNNLLKHSPCIKFINFATPRLFGTSGSSRVREITETENKTPAGKVEIVIEGRLKPSDRISRLVKVPEQTVSGCQSKEGCHPLCRLDFVNKIKHTGKFLGVECCSV